MPEQVSHLQRLVAERVVLRQLDQSASGPAGTGAGLSLPPRAGIPAIDPDRRQFRLSELLAFYDRDFVQFAYLVVLGRDPDTAGLDARLQSLQQGHRSRVGLLVRMRHSAEGKARGVRVAGLYRAFAVESAGAVPVLGFLIRGLRAVLSLPRLHRELEDLRANLVMQRNDMDDRLARVVEYQNRVSREARYANISPESTSDQ